MEGVLPVPDSAGARIGLAVRPPRIAVGVPSIEGISWQRQFEAALAAQTRVWGGIGNLVFPLTPDFTEKEVFWQLADRFDADAFVTFTPTVGDMETIDPKWFGEREAALRAHGTLASESLEAVEDFLERDRELPLVEPSEPTNDQRRQIALRLAPFRSDEGADFTWLTSNAPGWPLVDAAAFASSPQRITASMTRLGPVLRLLLTTELGRPTPSLVQALRDEGTAVERRQLDTPFEVMQAIFRSYSEHELTHPWEISHHGLAEYRRGRYRQAPVVLVTGDSAWDFAFFYAVRRLSSLAFWLPSALRRNQTYLYFLFRAIERWARRNANEVLVATTSARVSFRDEAATLLRAELRGVSSVQTASWREVLPDEPNRWYERDNFGVPLQIVPMEGPATTEMPTPLPRQVETRDPSVMRWVTEVEVEGWAPVRHPAVGDAILDAHRSEFQRATRAGAAYFCPATFFAAGSSLETIVVRPHLRPLPLIDQLREILEPGGWRLELSDKGIWAAETVALFGGRKALCAALRESTVMRLLRAYLHGRSGRELSGGRRVLGRKHVDELLGADAQAVLDHLFERRVLTRGLVLVCARCRQTAWYSPDDFGETFRCTRCRVTQAVRQGLRQIGDPPWFYDLAETVRQFLLGNGEVPMLAAETRFPAGATPVGHVVEVELYGPGWQDRPADKRKTLELDIAVSEGHRLWLGEASTDLTLSRRKLQRLRRVARATAAYGLVFATGRQTFPQSVQAAIERTFGREPVEVEYMHGIRAAA